MPQCDGVAHAAIQALVGGEANPVGILAQLKQYQVGRPQAEIERALEVTGQRVTAPVAVAGAHADGGCNPGTAVRRDRVPLVEIPPEAQVRTGLPILGVGARVADPTRKAVGAAALHGDFEAAGVASESVLQHRAGLREIQATPLPGKQAEVGLRRVNYLALLAVVSFGVNAQFAGEELIEREHGVRGPLGAQARRAEFAVQILQAGELGVLAGRE